jgi:hypothetical protein
MKKKLMSMGFTSLEILNSSEKKTVKGGGWYWNPCNVGGNRGPVKCSSPTNPGDSYYYCDMASCQSGCTGWAGFTPVCSYV